MKNTLMLRQFVDTIHTQFVEHGQIAFLFIEEEGVPQLFGLGKVIFAGHAKKISRCCQIFKCTWRNSNKSIAVI